MLISDRPIARAFTLATALGFGLTGCSFHIGSSSSSKPSSSSAKPIGGGGGSKKSSGSSKPINKRTDSSKGTDDGTKKVADSTQPEAGAPKRTKPEADAPTRTKPENDAPTRTKPAGTAAPTPTQNLDTGAKRAADAKPAGRPGDLAPARKTTNPGATKSTTLATPK